MFLITEEFQILKGCLPIALGVSLPWDIKGALITSGLSISFIGSFFLALYILGSERVRSIEKWIIHEFSIFAALNTITSGILRKRIIGGHLLEIPLEEEDLGRPITKQVLEKYFIRPRKVLLYHFLPILLITLVSIWIIAFYAFHLSPGKAFVVALFLSTLSFSQNLYQGFMVFLWFELGGLMIMINEVATKSLLYRKTWSRLAMAQLGIKVEETGKKDKKGRIIKKIKGSEAYIIEHRPVPLGQDILIFLTLTAMNLFFIFIWFVTAFLSIPPYLWTCIVLSIPRVIINKGLKYSSLWKVPLIGLIGISLLILGFFLQLLANLIF